MKELFAIALMFILVFVIGLECITISNVDKLNNQLREMKTEHRVIVEYKIVTDTIYKVKEIEKIRSEKIRLNAKRIASARYGLQWND